MADTTGTVILVRGTLDGGVVLRYVRGELLHPTGSYLPTDIPVALPRHQAADPNQITRPSAVRHPGTGHTLVARATFSAATGRTSIHVVSAFHPTMLAEATATKFERPVIINSAVVATHLGGRLMLAWNEAGAIKSCTSSDGVSWSAVTTLAPVPAAELFALWSEGDRLFLASTTSGRTAIVVRETTDGIAWTQQFPTGGTYACMTSNPFCLNGPATALSVATTADHVFVAYGETSRMKVARFRKGPSQAQLRSLVVSVVRQLTSPNAKLHHMAIHPSPFGWSLVFTQSFDDPSAQGGRTHYTAGLRSSDGIDYTGTEFGYARSSTSVGYPSLVLTGIPMPWTIMMHDSGRPPNTVYNFVLVADGFTYAERDHLESLYREMTTDLLNRAPFCFNKDLFNVIAVVTYSKDSGWADSAASPPKETMFGSTVTGNLPVSSFDPMAHAKLLLTGNRHTLHYYGWTFYNGSCGIAPSDNQGVPMCESRLHSLPTIHEYMHTFTGGFNFGDHELRANTLKIVNKTFDGTFSPGGTHAWQDWFVFTGTAPSRRIPVTDAYRAGLQAWVAAGNAPFRYWAFPYSTDPASPSYVDALSLFQPGLWESEFPDVADLSASPLYTAMRCCAMQSQRNHSTQFCPICSRAIVEHLTTTAGQPFTLAAFQNAPGAYLELQSRNHKACGETATPAALALDNLVVINGHALSASDFLVFQSDDTSYTFVARANLTPWVTPGATATLEFKQRSTGETRLWIPSIQVLNGKGARLPIHPAAVALPSGKALVDRLHEMHPTSHIPTAAGCDYEFWQLSEGDLTLNFVPH